MVIIIISASVAVPCAFAVWVWRNLRKTKATSKPTGKANIKPSQAQPTPEMSPRKPSPYTLAKSEAVVAFRIGARYYESNSDRVMECFAVKGKRQRFAAFATMKRVVEEKRTLAQFGDTGYVFNKVRIDSGVETCRRGNLRADRLATDAEILEDIAFEKRRDAIFAEPDE